MDDNQDPRQYYTNEGSSKKLDMAISDETVERIMGPDPTPQLDIEVPEIQNELQKKMVDEITCCMCQQFPFSPLECKNCNKLFCKHCQIQLQQGTGPNVAPHQTPGYDVCCPNCQARGDFLTNVNKVLQNCIDFCEFPHKCYKDEQGQTIWKTMKELQEHAINECPKFGCDICYHEDYQHMTRA